MLSPSSATSFLLSFAPPNSPLKKSITFPAPSASHPMTVPRPSAMTPSTSPMTPNTGDIPSRIGETMPSS